MAPLAIIIALDTVKYRAPYYFPIDKVFAADTFYFQRVKEAFRTGIVVAVASHAYAQFVPLQRA